VRELKCEEVDLLAYLSGTLNPQDDEAVHRHLSWCDTCRNELALLEEAADALPVALQPVLPPDTLRTKVLNEAFQMRPPISNVRNFTGVVGSAHARFRRPLKHLFPWSVSVVLLMLCIVLAEGWVSEQHRVLVLQQTLTHTATAVSLTPTQYLTGATGRVVIIPSHSGVELIVSVSNAKPTEGQEVYHVWLLNRGQRQSAGTLTVNNQGVGVLQVSLTGPKAKFHSIGITLEPNAMTTVPTGPKVFGADKV
jgi:hypothetical protein